MGFGSGTPTKPQPSTFFRASSKGLPRKFSRGWIDDQTVLPPLPEETAFERRSRLRKERKRLVGILHHESGREYHEIQQEVNEVVAAGRAIDDHTVLELEAALRMLTRQIAATGSVATEQAA